VSEPVVPAPRVTSPKLESRVGDTSKRARRQVLAVIKRRGFKP
jgi:hypothetical protein